MSINPTLLIAISFELMRVVRTFALQTSLNAGITLNLGEVCTFVHKPKREDFPAADITALYTGSGRGVKK